MKRSAPFARKAPLDSGAAAKRYEDRMRSEHRYPVRRIGRNRERSKEAHERDFGEKADYVRGLRCCACGAPPPSDPHHVRSRGAGGTSNDLVSLCRDCHTFGHAQGWETFAEVFGVDLYAEAERVEREWQRR